MAINYEKFYRDAEKGNVKYNASPYAEIALKKAGLKSEENVSAKSGTEKNAEKKSTSSKGASAESTINYEKFYRDVRNGTITQKTMKNTASNIGSTAVSDEKRIALPIAVGVGNTAESDINGKNSGSIGSVYHQNKTADNGTNKIENDGANSSKNNGTNNITHNGAVGNNADGVTADNFGNSGKVSQSVLQNGGTDGSPFHGAVKISASEKPKFNTQTSALGEQPYHTSSGAPLGVPSAARQAEDTAELYSELAKKISDGTAVPGDIAEYEKSVSDMNTTLRRLSGLYERAGDSNGFIKEAEKAFSKSQNTAEAEVFHGYSDYEKKAEALAKEAEEVRRKYIKGTAKTEELADFWKRYSSFIAGEKEYFDSHTADDDYALRSIDTRIKQLEITIGSHDKIEKNIINRMSYSAGDTEKSDAYIKKLAENEKLSDRYKSELAGLTYERHILSDVMPIYRDYRKKAENSPTSAPKEKDVYFEYARNPESAENKKNANKLYENAKYIYLYGSEDLKSVIDYVYFTEGAKKAEETAVKLRELADSSYAQAMAEEYEDKSKIGKFLTGLGASAEGGLGDFASGIEGSVTAFGDLIHGKTSYVRPNTAQIKASAVREAEDGGLARLGMDLTRNVVTQLPAVGVSAATGVPLAGQGVFGIQVYGNSYADAVNSGADKLSAHGYAAASTAMELGMQNVLGGIAAYGKTGGAKAAEALGEKFSGIKQAVFSGKNPRLEAALKVAGKSVLDAGSEAVEEGLQEVFEPVLRNALLKENNELFTGEHFSDILYSAFLGGLSANVLNAPAVPSEYAKALYFGEQSVSAVLSGDGSAADIENILLDEAQRKSFESAVGFELSEDENTAKTELEAFCSAMANEKFSLGSGVYSSSAESVAEVMDRAAESFNEETNSISEHGNIQAHGSIQAHDNTSAQNNTSANQSEYESVPVYENRDGAVTAVNFSDPNGGKETQRYAGAQSVVMPSEKEFSKLAKESPMLKNVGESNAEVFRTVGKAFGFDVKIFSSDDGADGFYSPSERTVYLNANGSQKELSAVFRHEIVHYLAENSAEEYRVFLKFVSESYKKTYGDEAFTKCLNRKRAEYQKHGKNLKYSDALEEFAADAGMDMLQNADFVTALVRRNRNTAQRILDAVSAVLNRLRRALGLEAKPSVTEALKALAKNGGKIEILENGNVERTYQSGILNSETLPEPLKYADLKNAEELLAAALYGVGANKNLNSAPTLSESPKNARQTDGKRKKRQLRQNYAGEVDRILKASDEEARTAAENRTAVTVLKSTPNVILKNIEGAENLKVIMPYTKLYLMARNGGAFTGNYHKLGAETAKKLPNLIKSPDVILQLTNGRINLLSRLETEKGDNGIVSIELNSTKDLDGKYRDYNVVVTMFGSKDNYVKNLILEKGGVEKYRRKDLRKSNPKLYRLLENAAENAAEKQKEDSPQVNPRLCSRPATVNGKSSYDVSISQNGGIVNGTDGKTAEKQKEDSPQVNPRLYSRPATVNGKSSYDVSISQNDGIVNGTDGKTAENQKEDSPQVNPRLYGRPAIVNGKSSYDVSISQNDGIVNSTDERNAVYEESGALKYSFAPSKEKSTENSRAEYIPKGENPSRDINVPMYDQNGGKVSFGARTAAEAEATPVGYASKILEDVSKGRYSYETVTDVSAARYAENYIKEHGYEQAYRSVVDSDGALGKNGTALAMYLYNAAANNIDFLGGYDSDGVQRIDKLLVRMVKSSSEAGQTLQGQRMLKKMSPGGMMYDAEQTVMRYNSEISEQLGKYVGDTNGKIIKGGRVLSKDDVNSLSEKNYRRFLKKTVKGREFAINQKPLVIDPSLKVKLLEAQTQAEALEAYSAITDSLAKQIVAKTSDKLRSFRYLSMLSNPRTMIRNRVGNALMSGAVDWRNFHVKAAESAMSLFNLIKPEDRRNGFVGLSKERRSEFLRLRDYAGGLFETYGDSVKSQSKYSDSVGGRIDEKRTIFNTKFLEKARKGVSERLEKDDVRVLKKRFAKTFAEAALARGYTAQAISDGEVSAEQQSELFRLSAIEAQRATFREASAMADILNKAKRSGGIAGFIIDAKVPFVKTPINVMKQGIAYSPASLVSGAVKLAKQTADYKTGKSEYIDSADIIKQIAQGVTGTELMLIGYWLSSCGLLKGADDEKDELNDLAEAEGAQAYSFEFELGEKRYSVTLDWAAPICIPLFMGTELEKMAENGGFDTADVIHSLGNLAAPVLETSMMSGILDTIETVRYASGGDIVGNLLADTVSGYAMQYVPAVVSAAAKTIDDVSSRTAAVSSKGGNALIERFARQFANRLPIVRGWVNAPYSDVFGGYEKKENVLDGIISAAQNFILPGYISEVSTTAATRHMTELAEKTGRLDFVPGYVGSITVGGKTEKLSGKEIFRFKQSRGEIYSEIIPELLEQEWYSELDAEIQADVMTALKKLSDAYCRHLLRDGYMPSSKEQKKVILRGFKTDDVIMYLRRRAVTAKKQKN